MSTGSIERKWSAAAMMAALWAGGGMLALLAVASPFSPHAPTATFAAFGIAAVIVAGVMWLARRRMPDAVLHVLVVVAILVVSASITQMKTTTGLTIGAFAYVWAAIYVAMVFSRRAAFAYAALMIASFGVGGAVAGLPHTASVWLLVSGTVIVTIVALSSLSAQLRRQAATDPLTGVLNRTGLARAAERETALAGRTGLALSVVVLDLDEFKAINDREGHAGGDRILTQTTSAWQQALRASDILARTGGDEFALVLPATEPEEADHLLARLRGVSDVPWSAGAARWEQPESFEACVARADQALMQAKRERRGQIRFDQSVRSTSLATRSPERTAPSM